MATQDAYSDHTGVPADAHNSYVERPVGALEHRRERRAQRERARLMTARNRRTLARRLRLTARLATDRDPIRRRHDVLLHYRAAAVRTDLLEIAALHNLLANGCDSPLYNAHIHLSELRATLDYIRSGL